MKKILSFLLFPFVAHAGILTYDVLLDGKNVGTLMKDTTSEKISKTQNKLTIKLHLKLSDNDLKISVKSINEAVADMTDRSIHPQRFKYSFESANAKNGHTQTRVLTTVFSEKEMTVEEEGSAAFAFNPMMARPLAAAFSAVHGMERMLASIGKPLATKKYALPRVKGAIPSDFIEQAILLSEKGIAEGNSYALTALIEEDLEHVAFTAKVSGFDKKIKAFRFDNEYASISEPAKKTAYTEWVNAKGEIVRLKRVSGNQTQELLLSAK